MTEPTATLASIRAEFERYRRLAERAMEQLDRQTLCAAPPGGLSIASLVWHISGNLESRFTDFLTTDGEKPWRERDREFDARDVSRDEMLEKWNRGWGVLFATLDDLGEADLAREVTIRGQPWSVVAALHRALPHVSYHVGQIVYTAKAARGDAWDWLTVAPGGTAAYNANPNRERGAG